VQLALEPEIGHDSSAPGAASGSTRRRMPAVRTVERPSARLVHGRACGIDNAPRGRHGASMLLPRRILSAGAALGGIVPALRGSALSLVAAACALLACGPTQRPDGGSGLLAVGAAAPDFAAKDAQGAPVRLSQARGKVAVVYFYPKDETPGCTKQACAFRDNFAKFEHAGVTVFGISRDSQQSHDAFRAHHRLPFALLADEDGAVQRAYGVPSKMPGMSARVTFLVDRDGKIARVWPQVDPVQNVTEVLNAAQQLGQAS
jgi:peroxiredoxin Q/BCP